MRWLLSFTQNAGLHWFGQRAALIMRGIGLRRLKSRPTDVTVEPIGANMRLYPFNNACEKRLLFTPQLVDRDELRYLAGQITPEMVFLDLGASVGATSLFVALRAGPRARILAVEPQPRIYERLVYNLRQNPAATVKALDCALADAEGAVTLFINPYNLNETSMRIVNVEGGGAAAVQASAKSLATLVREEGFTHIDAIKLDVEGAEDLVLEPFLTGEPESVWPRIVILAYSPERWDVDLCGLLQRCGYRRVLRTRANVIYERQAAVPVAAAAPKQQASMDDGVS